MQRRTFLHTALAATAAAQPQTEWGSPVLDIHLHPRRGAGSAIDHLSGAGVTKAVLLTRIADAAKAKQEIAAHPGRFAWFASTDPSQPDAMKISYPSTKVKPGGLTGRWLADHPNLLGDLSANSGFNALTRDRDFTRGFLSRHRKKLLFGCDCSCRDGRGTGGSPILPQLKGLCVARATLQALKELAAPDVFRNIVWDNGTTLLRLDR